MAFVLGGQESIGSQTDVLQAAVARLALDRQRSGVSDVAKRVQKRFGPKPIVKYGKQGAVVVSATGEKTRIHTGGKKHGKTGAKPGPGKKFKPKFGRSYKPVPKS